MTKQDLTYWMMYHEVHNLKRQGCSIRKIAEELVINFRTVQKYLLMTEEEFFQHLEDQDSRYKKLSIYEEFVKNKLSQYPETKSAQMHDWLKENYPKFPSVCPKTVFNFVLYIRQKFNIPQQYESRSFFPVEELEYGHQGQVDFGEYTLRSTNGSRKKVYFFAMVLSRSRQKYIYFSTSPFTANIAILSHEKAFAYFQGLPQEIVYDQDKVFLHNENKGDLILTKEFKAYCSQRGFKLHFCRKSDPQSKGKVENVIKYVKQNFLYNRAFIDIETLNDQAEDWLSRTANLMVHHRTRKVPFYEWQTEKNYLKTYIPITMEHNPYTQYYVRKDNTIAYKGSFYTLPEGTYINNGTVVLINTKDEQLCLYNTEKQLICTHPISKEKGKLVRNTDHKRDKSQKINQVIEQIASLFDQPEQIKTFLENIRKSKPRYIRDQLLVVREITKTLGTECIFCAISYCQENNIYDATNLKSVAEKFASEQRQKQSVSLDIKLLATPEKLYKANIKPLNSNIDDYEKIIFN
jgi:transposase